jgi:hypothetical protein
MRRSSTPSISWQSGVAMVIALLMSAVLSLLALQITINSRSHARLALEIQNRSENLMAMNTVEAEMVFALLTEKWVAQNGRDPNAWSAVWNFRGTPFQRLGSKITIQDESGLLPMPQPGDSAHLLERMLLEAGVSPGRANLIARDLESLHYETYDGGRRPIPVQSVYELIYRSRLTPQEARLISDLTTLFPNPHFNPDTAPEAVLRSRLYERDVDTLLRLRADQTRYQSAYAQELAAIGDELVVPFVGPALRWSIDTNLRGQSHTRRGTIVVRPYSTDPVTVWSYRRLGD